MDRHNLWQWETENVGTTSDSGGAWQDKRARARSQQRIAVRSNVSHQLDAVIMQPQQKKNSGTLAAKLAAGVIGGLKYLDIRIISIST